MTARGRKAWLFTGASALAVVVVAAGVMIERHLGRNNPAAYHGGVDSGFPPLEKKLHAAVGIAVSAVGHRNAPMTL